MSRRLRKRGFTRGPLETDQEPEDARARDISRRPLKREQEHSMEIKAKDLKRIVNDIRPVGRVIILNKDHKGSFDYTNIRANNIVIVLPDRDFQKIKRKHKVRLL
jgi:hypothetical protein